MLDVAAAFDDVELTLEDVELRDSVIGIDRHVLESS